MKSDREMIESLLKRRDEYMAQNGSFKKEKYKISSPVRFISGIAFPSLAIIAVIVCVLAFNGVFDRKRIDIDLVGAGSSRIPDMSLPVTGTADESTENDKKDDSWYSAFSSEALLPSQTQGAQDTENEKTAGGEIRVSDIMESVWNNMHFVENDNGIIEIRQLPIGFSEFFIYDGMIYRYVDPEKEDYSSLGFDENTVVIADPLHQAVVFQSYDDGEPKEFYGSVYEVKGMEDCAAVIYEDKIWLYRAERPAYLTVGDSIYRLSLLLDDNMWYSDSGVLVEESKDYSVYYALMNKFGLICSEENGKPVYVVKNKTPYSDGKYEAWISYSKNPLPPSEYRLNINAKGKIEDRAQKIESYCRNLSNGVFRHDTYEILSWNEDNIVNDPKYRSFVYKANTYRPVNGTMDSDTVLTLETNIEIDEREGEKIYCTVFGVSGNKDMIAVFCNGVLHYFERDGKLTSKY